MADLLSLPADDRLPQLSSIPACAGPRPWRPLLRVVELVGQRQPILMIFEYAMDDPTSRTDRSGDRTPGEVVSYCCSAPFAAIFTRHGPILRTSPG
jgi:hypothetical protein